MVELLRKVRRNLVIMFTLFSLLIILLLSYVDMNRMSKQLEHDYAVKIELVEMNIIHALKGMDQEYNLLDKKIADEMKVNSKYLLKKYEKNDHFDEWDFEELKDQFGMDVYIINQENQVIKSSFKKDIGLDFKKCCSNLSKLLDERRENGQFIHDGMDLEQKTGELKKYSYLPTRDRKYIIELSYDLANDQNFQKFDFLTIMKELKENYNFIEGVSIHTGDNYSLNQFSIQNNNDTHQAKGSYVKQIYNSQDPNEHIYIKYQTNQNQGASTSQLVEIIYNHDEINKVLLNNKITFILQFFGTLVLAISLVFLILKIVEKPMYLAFHDGLTGLKNRAAFENEVTQLLVKKSSNFGILLLDLDNFKMVNDTLGHAKGDLLLKYMAAQIESVLPHQVFFARFGGDEFTVLLHKVKGQDDLQKLAHVIMDSINNPQFEVNSSLSELFVQGIDIVHSKNVRISIGGVMYPDDGDNLEALYKKADLALYRSKERGKNVYTYYGDMEMKTVHNTSD